MDLRETYKNNSWVRRKIMKKKPSKQAAILRRHVEKCKKYMDPEEFQTLTFGLDQEEIGDLAGVTAGTVRRWMAGSAPIPYAVQQLFRLRCCGVIGKDWEGWRFGTDGLLYHPSWRRGFTGLDLAGMWYGVQRVASLERQVRQLEKERMALALDLERLEDLAAFYRRQVQLEAKMGLALVRIAG